MKKSLQRALTTVWACALMGFSAQSMAQTSCDISALPENAVTMYSCGSEDFQNDDLTPILSSSSGYSEKWEFYLYGDDFNVRLKFEISNFAFSKNEGKVKGKVVKKTPEGEVDYPISATLKSGQWKAGKDGLALDFGDYHLDFDNQIFHLKGKYEKGEFDFDIPGNLWKPGTGSVYFGNSKDNVFKYGVLSYHQTARGKITFDGNSFDAQLQAYGNHYATTLAVYDMFNEVADFRHRDEHLLVEFRYFVPSQKYSANPFGFMFVAFDGVPVLSSTQIDRTSLETWLDEDNYSYEIDSRQRIEGTEGSNKGRFEILSATPVPCDPYANLPAFQRNVASRFAKPVEYNIKMQWELWLDVDGIRARIPAMNGSYSVTRLR